MYLVKLNRHFQYGECNFENGGYMGFKCVRLIRYGKSNNDDFYANTAS